MEKPNAFIKMNFDKLGCMVLVELFHNSPIGPLSIPRIIERERTTLCHLGPQIHHKLMVRTRI